MVPTIACNRELEPPSNVGRRPAPSFEVKTGIVRIGRLFPLLVMATFMEHAYSLVHQDNTADQPTLQELKTHLEKGSDESKVETMKKILTIMLNGDPMPSLLMHIIRFVMPSKSKALKKLLYFYYEIVPKLDAGGKLKQEMILVW